MVAACGYLAPLRRKLSVIPGTWLILGLCSSVRLAEEAFGALARLSADRGWRLWYLRPKVHLFQHVTFLGCKGLPFHLVFRVRVQMQWQLDRRECQWILNPASPGLKFNLGLGVCEVARAGLTRILSGALLEQLGGPALFT